MTANARSRIDMSGPRGTWKLRVVLCLVVASGGLFAQPAVDGQVAVPTLTERVTDLTGTLASADKQALEQMIIGLETRKGSQIAVLIVPTTGPEAVEQYSLRVVEAWKLGRGKVDDGILLLVAKEDRTLRIEVGYGLEGAVPDATANRIIEEIIVPRFKSGDFNGGIHDGVDRLIRIVEGEPLPEPSSGDFSATESTAELPFWENEGMRMAAFITGAVILFIVSFAIAGIWGTVQSVVVTGITSILMGWILMGFFWGVGLALILLLFLFLSTLDGGSSSGGSYSSSSSSSSWSSSSSSSSSSSGYSGGGGSFGGGGASGSW